MEGEGFETVQLRNMEGLAALLSPDQLTTLNDDSIRDRWFDVLRRTCELPDLLGATLHFLYVGIKV